MADNTSGAFLATAAIPGVGTVASGIGALIASLGISVKGATKHLSYDVANPRAVSYGVTLYGDFVTTYGANVDQIKAPDGLTLWQHVQHNFLNAMNVWWGVQGHPNGIPIANSFANTDVPLSTQPLHTEAQLYWLWILQGIDATASQSVVNDTINATWDLIWSPALQACGLDPARLTSGGQITKVVQVTTPSSGAAPSAAPNTAALASNPVMVVLSIGVAIGIIYGLTRAAKKGK